jgi:3-hydroxyisobutyrate dehydrogenase
MKRIGFVGLGIMGQGMAANLLNRGFAVTIWNRTESKSRRLIEMGATLAPSLSSLARESEVIVTMLRDDAVVRNIVIDQLVPSAKPGTTFLEMSTITPEVARTLSEAVKARGCYSLEAPVMGSKEAAEKGQLIILVGGPLEVMEAQHDILSALGQKILHVGPNGSSAFLKLACNQMVASVMAAMGESVALIERAGLDRTQAVEIFATTLSRVAAMKQQKIAEQDWSTHFALDLMLKDLTQALQAAKEIGVPMSVLTTVREKYLVAQQQGKGELDFSVMAGG